MREHADVVIIGAGAGGAAAAFRLAERGAGRIVCLEQGGWIDAGRLPKADINWESRARREWAPNPSVRGWPADYPVHSAGADEVDPNLYNAVGGSTIGFYGQYWRLSPSDFRMRSLDGAGVDWPICYADLAPYYDANERMIGLSGLAGDPAAPPRQPPPCPPVPPGPAGRRLASAFGRLGWCWWPTDQAVITRGHSGRPACTNRGFCAFGCPQRSFSTADVAYWPHAVALGVELRTGSRVREIVMASPRRASGVIYYDGSGHAIQLDADVVILAAGGLGTPRLLMLSTARSPDGLANASGLVGRNLMVHVQRFARGVFAEPVEGWQGPPGTVATRQFYETDSGRGYLRGFVMNGGRGSPPLQLASEAPWGEGHHEAVRELLNHDMVLGACGDDLPETSNLVSLDWSRPDSAGLPGMSIEYALARNSEDMLEEMRIRQEEALLEAGASAVQHLSIRPLRGWHLLGTARMGTEPDSSVADADQRAHEIDNLFFADASLFPTGGGVNPANTVQALGLRCADRILALRHNTARPRRA